MRTPLLATQPFLHDPAICSTTPEDAHADAAMHLPGAPSQAFGMNPPEAVVMPGDTLVTSCSYDTTTREQVTTYGDRTQDEMCFAFVMVRGGG
eukprot:366402-Chlamydomonas_euryale.AAC.1